MKYMRNEFDRVSKETEQLIKDAEKKLKEVGDVIDGEVEIAAEKYNISKWMIWTGGTVLLLALAKIFIN